MQPTSEAAFIESMYFNETQMLHNNHRKYTAKFGQWQPHVFAEVNPLISVGNGM